MPETTKQIDKQTAADKRIAPSGSSFPGLKILKLRVQSITNHKHALIIYILSQFVQSLLDEPNPNSPANSLAAQLYQENRREYEKKVSNPFYIFSHYFILVSL